MKPGKLLLHSCCAPCTTYSLRRLRDDGYEVKGLFYNPNIHPYTEYRKRLEAFVDYCARVGHDALIVDEYGLRDFLSAVRQDFDERCAVCYEMRLHRAARQAIETGCDAFTTSLTISPYQNHDLIKAVGSSVAEQEGVEFRYFDFRPGYRESVSISREMGLYRQGYCGCIFSEEDRYARPGRKV
ncbi:MAG: hypothetical protein BWY85_02320 [Firmicutes bacterium ADurb.Bin506]|nr:MAG: hypothetical protein BWY85_02320 [Firmicutes bacterium ADurb.Bin506]